MNEFFISCLLFLGLGFGLGLVHPMQRLMYYKNLMRLRRNVYRADLGGMVMHHGSP
jgi:hypothetical protein